MAATVSASSHHNKCFDFLYANRNVDVTMAKTWKIVTSTICDPSVKICHSEGRKRLANLAEW